MNWKPILAMAGILVALGVILTGCGQSSTNADSSATGANGGASASAESSAYELVDPAAAKKLIDDDKVTVVDVRTASEYAGGHIKGAINIPVDTIGSTQPTQLADLKAPILVYCHSGVRSKWAADAFVGMGYAKVYDLSGGIIAWPYGTE